MSWIFQKSVKVTTNYKEEENTANISLPQDANSPNSANDLCNNIIARFIIGLSFFLPLFFLPFAEIPFTFGKSILASVVILIAFIIWLIIRLKTGNIYFPRLGMISAAILLSVSVFIASILSPATRISLFGIGGETDTFAFIFIATLVFLLTAISFSNWKHITHIYAACLSVFIVSFLFYVIRFIWGVDALSFGIFNSITSGPLGSWNDFGIFSGGIAILSLFSLYALPHTRVSRFFVFLFLILSLIALFIVNFSVGWILVGIFSLIVFVYTFSFLSTRETKGIKRIALLPLVLTVLSIVFIIFSQQIGTTLSKTFNISTLDARPTWGTTLHIVKNTLPNDPLFGVGPNRFFNQWLLYKPDGINSTIFWNTDFNAGIGSIPSFAVTTGAIGAVSWLVFLLTFIIGGLKALRMINPREKISHYFSLSLFLASFYFWVVSIFYIASYAIFFFAFLFSGLFAASLVLSGVVSTKRFSFSDSPQKSFISVLAIIFFIIVGTVGLYISGQKAVAAVIFNQGIKIASSGDINIAMDKIKRASDIDGQGLYYRFLADAKLSKMNSIIALAQDPEKIDSVRIEFQNLLSEAITSSQNAVLSDETDYKNWRARARVYHSVVSLEIPGAYENAVQAYDEARARNPKSPAISLDRAQLELARGNTEMAKNFISEALFLKNNYTDALYMLSQIELDEGRIKEAISSVEIASLINPNDPGVFFRLGFLRYADNDYSGAISALDRAVILQPQYANARYFLGLSYSKVGKINEAIEQFKIILTTNQDNEEVRMIIKNLESDKNPLSGVDESDLENKFTPPIQE